MPDNLPIACSLTAGDLQQRLAEIAALGADALLTSSRDGAHAELRFAAGGEIRERVEAIVAAESRCCAFLSMQVRDDDGTVLLVIDAPADAELVLAEFVDAFGAGAVAA